MDASSPTYLSVNDIVTLHAWVIGHIGGMPGIRDAAALESCVAQPKTAVFDRERFPTVYDKAAAYCYFITRAHPFFDGNKRTGLLAALHYLLDADVTPVFDVDEMYGLITGIVAGEVEVEQLADAFRKAGQGRR